MNRQRHAWRSIRENPHNQEARHGPKNRDDRPRGPRTCSSRDDLLQARIHRQDDLFLSAADDLLRYPDDKPSIGIILCKTKNQVVADTRSATCKILSACPPIPQSLSSPLPLPCAGPCRVRKRSNRSCARTTRTMFDTCPATKTDRQGLASQTSAAAPPLPDRGHLDPRSWSSAGGSNSPSGEPGPMPIPTPRGAHSTRPLGADP
jgi:hypothetical protein